MHALARSAFAALTRRPELVAVLAAALFAVPLRSARACTGAVPKCQPCFVATCSADVPQWHCDFAAAGTACNDGNACTSSDHCDGDGTCIGTAVVCPGADHGIVGVKNFTLGVVHAARDFFGGMDVFRLEAASTKMKTYYNTFIIRSQNDAQRDAK
ncbi:MAG TPA: hypothetical protein VGH20_08425 [Myxococcales bacterium]